MTEEKSFIECRACGNLNDINNTQTSCWICQQPLDSTNVVMRPASEGAQLANRRDTPTTAQSIFATVLVVVFALICLGAFLEDPGAGIGLAILGIIPMIRTFMVVGKRKLQGDRTSFITAALMFFSSMVVSWVILTVVTVAAFGTFCLTCLGAYAVTNGTEQLAFPIAGVVALIAVGFVAVFCWKWIDARWERDTKEF